MNELKCELCSDKYGKPEVLVLSSRCHMTAPLQATYEPDGTLILRCYIPDCRREVARFKVTPQSKEGA